MLRSQASTNSVKLTYNPLKKLMPDTFLKHSPRGKLSYNSVHPTQSQLPRIPEKQEEDRFDLQVTSAEHVQFLRLDGEKLKRAISTMPVETVRAIIQTYNDYSRTELGLKTSLEQADQTPLTGDPVPSLRHTHVYENKPCSSEYGW